MHRDGSADSPADLTSVTRDANSPGHGEQDLTGPRSTPSDTFWAVTPRLPAGGGQFLLVGPCDLEAERKQVLQAVPCEPSRTRAGLLLAAIEAEQAVRSGTKVLGSQVGDLDAAVAAGRLVGN